MKLATVAPRAPRNPFAYLFALIPPGAILPVFMIGLLAAMAFPAFEKVRQASLEKACHNNRRIIDNALDQHTLETGKTSRNLADVIGPGKLIQTMPVCPAGGRYLLESNRSLDVSCSLHGHGEPQMPGGRR